jgi:hypothetical protein
VPDGQDKTKITNAITDLIKSLAPDDGVGAGVGLAPTVPTVPQSILDIKDVNVAKGVLKWIEEKFGDKFVLEAVSQKMVEVQNSENKLFVGGRLRTVHRGSRGGKYVVVKGKKVYL